MKQEFVFVPESPSVAEVATREARAATVIRLYNADLTAGVETPWTAEASDTIDRANASINGVHCWYESAPATFRVLRNAALSPVDLTGALAFIETTREAFRSDVYGRRG